MKKIMLQCFVGKRFMALALGLAACAAAGAASPRFTHARVNNNEAAETPAPNWVPGTETVFYRLEEPDKMGNIWGLDFVSSYTYNNAGLAVVTRNVESTGGRNRVTQTYDSRGYYTSKLVEIQVGAEWLPSEKVTRKFDEITGVVTEYRAVNYDENGKESLGNSYNRVISRDDLGRIVSVEIQTPFNGKYDPSQRINITYGENGLPSTIAATDLAAKGAGFEWVESGKYTDIVWENCNCQITSLDALFQGENRIKSAHFYQPYNGQPYFDYDVNVEYADSNSTDYRSEVFGTFQGYPRSGRSMVFKQTDAYGSYTLTAVYYSLKADSDEREYAEYYQDIAVYDSYGNDVLVRSLFRESPNQSWQLEEEQKSEVTYDPIYGYPLSIVVSFYDPETRTSQEIMKIDYSDYIDANTIVDVEGSVNEIITPVSGPTQWFDLSGRRVAKPARGGIYIRRNGAHTEKITF